MNRFSIEPSDSELANTANELLAQLKASPEKNLPAFIEDLSRQGEAGLSALMLFLQERCHSTEAEAKVESSTYRDTDLIAGKVYQTLFAADSLAAANFLQTYFPTGVVSLRSQANIDYHPLQILLAKQDFQTADQLTLQKLCELAGQSAVQRKWVYFTEVEQFPAIDLQTINSLWLAHSQGKFGFSVQREIWLSLGKNWDKLWPKIGWRDGINWTRYPQGFTWDLSAPRGHLPLSNQLRGVRVMSSLMAHSAWNRE